MIFSGEKKIRIRVAALLVGEEGVLMVAHKKRGSVYWLLPGGGVAYGESLPAALARELHEELGIQAAVGDIAFLCDSIEPGPGRHILHVVFHCTRPDGEIRLGHDKRLYDYRYYRREELEGITVFPPVKDEITALMEGAVPGTVYLKKNWVPL